MNLYRRYTREQNQQDNRGKVAPDWGKIIDWFFKTEEGKVLDTFLTTLDEQTCCPEKKNIFNAFVYTPMADTKVVILGQDPYYTPEIATGLAFACPEGYRVPPSLKNIIKEVANDVYGMSGNDIISPDLLPWASQGVLLLNTALTTIEGTPGVHTKQWDTFTRMIISTLGKQKGKVFMLWGQDAQAYEGLLDHENNLVLRAAHPSPLSVNKGFAGCKHFSAANEYLKKTDQIPIVW